MSISTPFIRRPVATTLSMVAITLAGAIAYTLLPVSALPEVDFPTIFVTGSLPGASPEVMAASVATPLEKQFTHIAGVTEMTSRSSVGSANVTLQFDLSRDINGAAREVQAAINSAAGLLPANLPSLPRYRKINPADQPILLMTLESDVVPRPQLYDIASSVFAQKLAQVQGVGQVSVGGSSLPAVRVEVNPQPLSRYNVGLDQIGTFLQGANANRPKGSVANAQSEKPLYATDQLFLAKDYKDLVVVYRNGAPVRLSDLGRVIDGNEDVRNLGLVNGNPMVQIQINRQPGANVVETVARIKALMPQFQAQLPPTVRFKIASDRTITTRDSLHDAQRNVIVSITLVILVVFIFLRNGWSTFIPSVSVPISIVATFGVMYLFGYTLDNLSLMALTIATGFVVDDAIVVIENITRHLEAGMKPMQAAFKGASEIGFTVLSMSISLIAVFIPILMMSGIVGRLFREFSMVLASAIVVSMAVSLTAIPMMCAWLLRPEEGHGALYNWTEKFYRWIISTYASALDVVLNHPAPIMVVFVLTLGINVYLYDKIPKGFFPQQDTGRLQGSVQGQQHISYQALVEKAKWFEEKIHHDPDVETVTMVAGSSGGGGFGGATQAQMNVQLKPVGVRKSTSDQVIARLRRQTSGVPGAILYSAEFAGCARGRAASQRAISVHAASARFRIAIAMGTESSGRAFEPSRDRRCQLRPAEFRLVVECGDRSRHRVASRAHRAGGRLGDLRRLWPAPGLGDVQIDQPVPRGSGARAEMVGEPGLPEDYLRANAQGHGRSFIDFHALHARPDAHFAAPPGTVPGQHHLVQPQRRLRAQRCGRGHPPRRSGDWAAGEYRRQARGYRARLRGSAQQSADPHRDRADRGLYRARNTL